MGQLGNEEGGLRIIMVVIHGGHSDVEGPASAGEGQVHEELLLVHFLQQVRTEDKAAVPVDFLLFRFREEAAFLDAFRKFPFYGAGDEDCLRLHTIAPVHAGHRHVVQGRGNGGIGEGREAIFEEGTEIFGPGLLVSGGVDNFVQKGKNFFPHLQVRPEVGPEFFFFIQPFHGFRYFFVHQPLVENPAAVFREGRGFPLVHQGIQHGSKPRPPAIGFSKDLLFPLRQGGQGTIELPVFPEYPLFVILGGPDTVGEDVIFEAVHIVLRPLGQEECFQQAEKSLPLPAAPFMQGFGGEKTEKAADEYHQGMAVHGMLPVDEARDFIASEGPLEEVPVVIGIPDEHQDVPVPEMAVPDEGENAAGNVVHLLRLMGGPDEMEPLCRGGGAFFIQRRRYRAAVEEMPGYSSQLGRGKTAVFGEKGGRGGAFLSGKETEKLPGPCKVRIFDSLFWLIHLNGHGDFFGRMDQG